MSITETKVKRTVTTETKIKRALTRLQKLVQQYYDENPDTTDSRKGGVNTINYYGSALFGTIYNGYTDKWQAIANITINGKCDWHIDICSPIDHKPIKQEVNMKSTDTNLKIYISEKEREQLFKKMSQREDYSDLLSAEYLETICLGKTYLSDKAYGQIRRLLKQEYIQWLKHDYDKWVHDNKNK